MDKLDILEHLKEIEEQCADLECCECKYEEVCDQMTLSCPCKMYRDVLRVLNFESINLENK